MANTPREIRENLIKKRHKKKQERDELLETLGGDEIMGEEVKKKTRKEIIKDFYENFEEEKTGEEGFQSADEQYRDIKRNRYQLEKKKVEVSDKKEGTKADKKKIEDEMFEIASIAMDLENGSWWKKWSLKKNKEKRNELESQRKKIDKEILELAKQRTDLERALDKRKKEYGYPEKHKLGWSITFKKNRKDENVEEGEKDWEVKYDTGERWKVKEGTLKGYKERYYQMIKDKEEYMKNLLSEMRGVDMGISEEMKEKVLEQVESDMKKDIEKMEGGDDVVKLADETERWLKDNWKSVMEKLSDLKGKIKEKEKQVENMESKENGASTEDLFQIKEEEFELKKQLLELKNGYESIKLEFTEKLKKYNGMRIDLGEIVVETWEERILRLYKKYLKEDDSSVLNFNKPSNETTEKGFIVKMMGLINRIKTKLNDGYFEEKYGEFSSSRMGMTITEEMKENVWKDFEAEITAKIQELEEDKYLKDAQEDEKWLKENWRSMMEKLVDLQVKIKDTEDEVEKSNLQHEYDEIRRNIDRKLEVYDDSDINWRKELHIETWDEKKEREEKDEREKKVKPGDIPETYHSWLDSVRNQGSLYSHKIQYGTSKTDIIGVALLDYSKSYGSYSGMEYGRKLFVKRGENSDVKTFVWRDHRSSEYDDSSKAYTDIVKVEAEDDKVIVTVRKNQERKISYTFYLEKNEEEEKLLSKEAQAEFKERIEKEKERLLKEQTRENGMMPSNYDLVYMQTPGAKIYDKKYIVYDKKYEEAKILDEATDLGKGECYILIKTQIDADATDGIQYAWLKYKITPTNTELVEQENAYQSQLMHGKEINISVR